MHVSRLLQCLAWFVAIGALYLVLEDHPVTQEFYAAGIAGILGATAVALLEGPEYAQRYTYVLRACASLAKVPRDCFVVASAVVHSLAGGKHLEGSFERVPFNPGRKDDPDARLRRALVTLEISLAPNSFVVEIEDHDVLVHHLR
jgi:hypothetical protein